MKILVTGGAGLVGSHAVEYYKNEKVVALDNLMRSTLFGQGKSVEYNWEYISSLCTRVRGDVRDDLKEVVKNVDVVIHTAGQPGVPLSMERPKEDFSINAFGTLNLLETLRKVSPKVKFIYCSTNKVYGENVHEPNSEMTIVDHTGHTPYGVSKLTGDLYTQEYARLYGFRTGVFRMSCTYGVRQFGFEGQGWVSHFITKVLKEETITIFGDGTQVRDLLYVTDLIEAFDKFIKYGKSDVFNIGGGPENKISLLGFLEKIESLTGKKPKLVFKDWRPSDQKTYVSDITKVSRVLDWTPKVGIDEGIQRILDWVLTNPEMYGIL